MGVLKRKQTNKQTNKKQNKTNQEKNKQTNKQTKEKNNDTLKFVIFFTQRQNAVTCHLLKGAQRFVMTG